MYVAPDSTLSPLICQTELLDDAVAQLETTTSPLVLSIILHVLCWSVQIRVLCPPHGTRTRANDIPCSPHRSLTSDGMMEREKGGMIQRLPHRSLTSDGMISDGTISDGMMEWWNDSGGRPRPWPTPAAASEPAAPMSSPTGAARQPGGGVYCLWVGQARTFAENA